MTSFLKTASEECGSGTYGIVMASSENLYSCRHVTKRARDPFYHKANLTELALLQHLQLTDGQNAQICQLLGFSLNWTIDLFSLHFSQYDCDLYQFMENKECELLLPLCYENIFSQLVQGLYCLHRHSIYHLDIKPSNILIRFVNGQHLPAVVAFCDFGISTRKIECWDGGYNNYSFSDSDVSMLVSDAYKPPEIQQRLHYCEMMEQNGEDDSCKWEAATIARLCRADLAAIDVWCLGRILWDMVCTISNEASLAPLYDDRAPLPTRDNFPNFQWVHSVKNSLRLSSSTISLLLGILCWPPQRWSLETIRDCVAGGGVHHKTATAKTKNEEKAAAACSVNSLSELMVLYAPYFYNSGIVLKPSQLDRLWRIRDIIWEWLLEVTTAYKFSLETFCLGWTLLDCCIFDRIFPFTHQSRYQLLACACFSLCSSFCDEELSLSVWVNIANGAFSHQDLIGALETLVVTFKGMLCIPTAYHYYIEKIERLRRRRRWQLATVDSWSQQTQSLIYYMGRRPYYRSAREWVELAFEKPVRRAVLEKDTSRCFYR